MEEEDINWKERCLVLETSLQKFKEQVTKIRETLGLKVRFSIINCCRHYIGYKYGYCSDIKGDYIARFSE